jgi:hypothetical protein
MNEKVNEQVTEWPDLAIGLYDRLTGRGSAINYELMDMVVEVPRDTGENAPRATWRFNGTIRITTDEPGK